MSLLAEPRPPADPRSVSQEPSAPPFVLASASPRRLALLRQVGHPPDVVHAADVNETALPRELPRDHARRLAAAKADAIAGQYPGALVLGADTVVARGRRILPKPADAADATRCLRMLSGSRHRVWGGIALIGPDGRRTLRLVVTAVAFKRLTQDEIDFYVASGEWRGKAGGYAIQGRAAAFVRQIVGSYSNVVGLPLFETCALLQGAGLRGCGGESDAEANR